MKLSKWLIEWMDAQPERRAKGDYIVNAALWIRREAGASACDMVNWDNPVTTFTDQP